jgi:hypothetical protein
VVPGKQQRQSNCICMRLESLVDVVDACCLKENWTSLLCFHRNEVVDCCSHELHMKTVIAIIMLVLLDNFPYSVLKCRLWGFVYMFVCLTYPNNFLITLSTL